MIQDIGGGSWIPGYSQEYPTFLQGNKYIHQVIHIYILILSQFLFLISNLAQIDNPAHKRSSSFSPNHGSHITTDLLCSALSLSIPLSHALTVPHSPKSKDENLDPGLHLTTASAGRRQGWAVAARGQATKERKVKVLFVSWDFFLSSYHIKKNLTILKYQIKSVYKFFWSWVLIHEMNLMSLINS